MGNKIKTLDDIQQLLWSFATHRVITVAGRLGILRRLSQGSCTGEALAGELGLDQVATVKIVKALCALGLLEAQGDTYSTHSGLAEFFTPGDGDLTPFLAHSHSMYDSFGENLEGWVRGEPWKTRKRDEESIRKFGLAMQAMGTGVARQVKRPSISVVRKRCWTLAAVLDTTQRPFSVNTLNSDQQFLTRLK